MAFSNTQRRGAWIRRDASHDMFENPENSIFFASCSLLRSESSDDSSNQGTPVRSPESKESKIVERAWRVYHGKPTDPWESIFNEADFPEIGPVRHDVEEQRQAVGEYRLDEALGKGGFGKVYAGKHKKGNGNVEVAIKRVSKGSVKAKGSEQTRKHVKMVDTEIGILRSHSHHPNIIGFHEVMHTHQSVYIVQEKATMDLEHVTEAQFRQPDFRQQVMKGMLSAISHLHGAGCFHLDLKPENVLISLQHEDQPIEACNVRLADFGVSEVSTTMESVHLEPGNKIGTCGHMAPELLNEQGGDAAAADVWSIGVFLLDISGRLPERWITDKAMSSEMFASDILNLTGYCRSSFYLYFGDLLSDERPDLLFWDFVYRTVAVDPELRDSAENLLHHPWLETAYELEEPIPVP